MKATVTTVKLGNLEFEGLMLESGEFAVAQQQTAALFSVIPTTAPKWLKTLLGEDSQLFSVSTNRNEGTRQNRKENVLTLIQFEKVLRKLDRQGNKTAQSMCDDLIGLSLHQLFSDAFGIKFEKEDRQEWLKKRQATKRSFWFLTDAIKHWLDDNPSPNGHFIYSNTFNALNKGLFGKSAKEIKLELGIGKGDLNRDHFGELALQRIDYIQALAEPAIYKGRNPIDAVKEALAAYDFENIEYTA